MVEEMAAVNEVQVEGTGVAQRLALASWVDWVTSRGGWKASLACLGWPPWPGLP